MLIEIRQYWVAHPCLLVCDPLRWKNDSDKMYLKIFMTKLVQRNWSYFFWFSSCLRVLLFDIVHIEFFVLSQVHINFIWNYESKTYVHCDKSKNTNQTELSQMEYIKSVSHSDIQDERFWGSDKIDFQKSEIIRITRVSYEYECICR